MIRTFKQVAKYVYETLGPCHEEAIYRDAMSVELQDRGYTVKTEAPISIRYKTKKGKEMIVGSGKIDLLSFVVRKVGAAGTELLASAGLNYQWG